MSYVTSDPTEIREVVRANLDFIEIRQTVRVTFDLTEIR